MGLFSSLFGGSSTQNSTQNTTVENEIEINFDVDKLAKTMKENTLMSIFFESEVAVAELTAKEKEQKLKADAIQMSALSLKQQIKTDKNTMILTTVGILLAFIGLIYSKRRKRK